MPKRQTPLKVVHKQAKVEKYLPEQPDLTSLLCDELTHIITLLEEEFAKDKPPPLDEPPGEG